MKVSAEAREMKLCEDQTQCIRGAHSFHLFARDQASCAVIRCTWVSALHTAAARGRAALVCARLQAPYLLIIEQVGPFAMC